MDQSTATTKVRHESLKSAMLELLVAITRIPLTSCMISVEPRSLVKASCTKVKRLLSQLVHESDSGLFIELTHRGIRATIALRFCPISK